jgi:hypothetical protein
MAGCVKFIQINRGIIEVAELPGSCAKIRSVIKIRIFFFYPPIVGYNPEEENRQSEKLHSTLNVERNSRASSSIRFSVIVSYLQEAHPQGMIVTNSPPANARCSLESKRCQGHFVILLIKSIYDLIGAFVIAAVNFTFHILADFGQEPIIFLYFFL